MTKQRIKYVFLAALAVGSVSLLALLLLGGHLPTIAKDIVIGVGIAAAGLVTVTYEYPPSVAGGTVGPTAVQSAQLSMVTATLIMGTGDTTATITHNWGLSATEIAELFPVPIMYWTTPPTTDPFVSWVLASNSVTLNKASGAGTGFTANVVLLRPHTDIR